MHSMAESKRHGALVALAVCTVRQINEERGNSSHSRSVNVTVAPVVDYLVMVTHGLQHRMQTLSILQGRPRTLTNSSFDRKRQPWERTLLSQP